MKKNIIKAVCFTLILATVTFCVNYVLCWKDSLGIRQFYAMPKNTMDVIYFGSSHAEYGINTAYQWDDYGIASYSMTEGGQNLGTTYYYMVEALKYQKPKVMVVEMTFTAPRWEFAGNGNSYVYRSIVNMRYSKNFIDNVKYGIDVANTRGENPPYPDLWKYLVFKFPVYHTRYTDLHRTDFKIEKLERGRYEGSSVCVPQTVPATIDYDERCADGYDGIYRKEYVDKMIQLCEDHDIQLVFWISPYECPEEDMQVFNTVSDYSAEHGIPFLNFSRSELQQEIGFDYATDMIEDNHVNFDGCRKITNFFNHYLVDNCGVQSHKGESGYDVYQEIADYWNAWEVDLRAEGR